MSNMYLVEYYVCVCFFVFAYIVILFFSYFFHVQLVYEVMIIK